MPSSGSGSLSFDPSSGTAPLEAEEGASTSGSSMPFTPRSDDTSLLGKMLRSDLAAEVCTCHKSTPSKQSRYHCHLAESHSCFWCRWQQWACSRGKGWCHHATGQTLISSRLALLASSISPSLDFNVQPWMKYTTCCLDSLLPLPSSQECYAVLISTANCSDPLPTYSTDTYVACELAFACDKFQQHL